MAEFDEPLTPTSPNIIHYVARLPSDDVTTHSTHLHENGSDAVMLQGGDFAVKSRVLADLAHEPLQHPHSFGLVLVMSALFLLFILLALSQPPLHIFSRFLPFRSFPGKFLHFIHIYGCDMLKRLL